MVAIISKRPYGFQVCIGENIKKAQSKTFSFSVYGGEDNARKEAENYRDSFIEENNLKPPVKGKFALSFSDPPRKNNTSGHTGVYRSSTVDKRNKTPYVSEKWNASYKDDQGRNRPRSFSIKKFGEDGARDLAIRWREEWEEAARGGEKPLEVFFQEEKTKYPKNTGKHDKNEL